MPELSPARALLINPDQELPSEELTVPLSDKDLQTFELMERWRSGESLYKLSQEIGLTYEGLRRRFKVTAMLYSGKTYEALRNEFLANERVDWEEKLENAKSMVEVACAHRGINQVDFKLERRVPELFAPKREVKNEHKHQLVVVERRQSPKLLNSKDIDVETR
jgi:hypothetical protein